MCARAVALLALLGLTGCQGTPFVLPYPPEARPTATLVPGHARGAEPARGIGHAPAAARSEADSVGSGSRTVRFDVPGGAGVDVVVDGQPLPIEPPAGRSTFGPAGAVVLSGDGREAWFSSADDANLLPDEREGHARAIAPLPSGMRLLPIADYRERGCRASTQWGLFDPGAGLVHVEGTNPIRLERAPGAGPTAAADTVLLRLVHRSPRTGRVRVLYGARERVEAVPSGRAPGGWTVDRRVARVAGRARGEDWRLEDGSGLVAALIRESTETRGSAYRFWVEIDGHRIHAFDIEGEMNDFGVGGVWRSGNRALVWYYQEFDSENAFALVDLETHRRVGQPIAATPEPDWSLCSSATPYGHRLLAVLDDDEIDLVLVDPAADQVEQPIRFDAHGRGMGRIVTAKLPLVEDPRALVAVLEEAPCGDGTERCLVQALGQQTSPLGAPTPPGH